MNVSEMVRRLGGKKYKVTREAGAGSYSTVDGTFVQGSIMTLYLIGSLQPLNAEDLVSIPEGDRTRERYRFYSAPPLLNNDTARLRRGDLVDVSGIAYRVESVENWPNHGKAIVARVNTNAN